VRGGLELFNQMVKKNEKLKMKDKVLNFVSIAMILGAVFSFGFLVSNQLLKGQYNDSIKGMEDNYNSQLKESMTGNLRLNVSFKPEVIPTTEEEIINNCKLLNLKETAQCLVENIGTFYNYTITDDKINLTIKDIQEVGGDCRDYAFLYKRLAQGLNVKATTRTYQGISEIMAAHRWAVIWDDYEYCKLDQMKVSCYKSKKAIKNDETR